VGLRLQARELRTGYTIAFGGRRARVRAVRRSGALVTVLLAPLGAWLTYNDDHPVILLSTPARERPISRRAGRELPHSAGKLPNVA
jgi:hypothetical protein